MMENRFRLYGKAPYKVVLVHGGPAAWGEMAPVAKHLSSLCGIFEPFQTCPTLDGQIYELRDLIESKVEFPAILIGHSWGAWLSFLFTARFPTLVNKLILVGSGPFQQNYAENINFTRLGRMSPDEKKIYWDIMESLQNDSNESLNSKILQLGELCNRIDQFKLIDYSDPDSKVALPLKRLDFFNQSLLEVIEMRKNGKLLDLLSSISIPVVAIHGDFDPHPFEGVRDPLSSRLSKFKFYLLHKCGHTPWLETHASHEFFQILYSEIK